MLKAIYLEDKWYAAYDLDRRDVRLVHTDELENQIQALAAELETMQQQMIAMQQEVLSLQLDGLVEEGELMRVLSLSEAGAYLARDAAEKRNQLAGLYDMREAVLRCATTPEAVGE